MKEEYLKNSIISFFLIVSFVLMPLSFIPKKADAANINSYIGSLSGVISQLPLCQGSVKSLFNSNGLDFSTGKDYGITSGPSSSSGGIIGSSGTTLDELNDLANNQSEAIPVDVGKTVTESQTKTADETEKTAKSAEITKNNDTCLKSIGRTIIKMLLQKMTTDTVSWINGGIDGEPLFVENPGEYFKDIAKNEILGFGSEISDPTLYPFGKAFMQSQANSLKNKFANNAQYSLDKMIRSTNPQYSAETFNQDFSQGGWYAWDALTQNPANNPLGFTLMASNELGRRIEEKTSLAEGSLQQSGGYLGVQKCVNPEGVTKEEDDNARNGDEDSRICETWNFVTPGQMVATAASKLVQYPENNLLKSEDLNDAVAAILDAFLGSFSSSLMSEGGFAGMTDTMQASDSWSEGGEFVMNMDNSTSYDNSQVGEDYSSFQIKSSSFLAQNPNFNIRSDLNQALIDEQRIFTDKLIQQNKELKSTIPLNSENNPTGWFTGNYGLIPTIYQLDYCIPGPHPGFEQDSRAALDAALGVIPPEDVNSIKDKSDDELMGIVSEVAGLAAAAVGMLIGASIGSGIPIIGTIIGAVLGAVVGYLISIIGDTDSTRIREYYGGHMFTLTGVRVKTDTSTGDMWAEKVGALHNFQQFSGALNKILDRYIEIIYDVYDPSKMPSVTKEAAGKFLQIRGYNQMFQNNEARIVSMKSIIKRLGEIKNEIEKLNSEFEKREIKNIRGEVAPPENEIDANGNIVLGQKNQYEENLKPWISAFGRISQEMVTGDDIAVVDNTIKQIIDEKDYVYNDLLKGPNGCEKELELGKPNGGLPWQVYDTQRMVYPGPLLYDYNYYITPKSKDWYFPDPYNSGYYNKLKQDTASNKVGPGFLSWVYFESETTEFWCGDYWKEGEDCPSRVEGLLHGPLPLQDLFKLRNVTSTIGRRNSDNPDIQSRQLGTFEIMIGIY